MSLNDPVTATACRDLMLGRRVCVDEYVGTVIQWDAESPSANLLLRDERGREVYTYRHMVMPVDGLGELPDQDVYDRLQRQERIAQLEAIQEKHVREGTSRWYKAMMPFGAVLFDQAIRAAIEEDKRKG